MTSYGVTNGSTTLARVATNADVPKVDQANTAERTRRYAAASDGLSCISASTARKCLRRRSNRQRGTSRLRSSIATADPISGSRSASSRKDARAWITVPTSASNDDINAHDHMPRSMTASTDTRRPNG